jgi:uncharacterized protein (TIGR02118 family)
MAWQKVVAVVAPDDVAPLAAGAGRSEIHSPVSSQPPGTPTVVCLWYDQVPPSLPGEAYLVDESVQWGQEVRPAVIRFAFLRRAQGTTSEAFSRHWRDAHTPLARRHHPCLVRYVQNVVLEALTPGARAVDGVAELGVARERDFDERMYDSPEGRQAIWADVRRFLDVDRGWRVVTD